MKKWLLRKVDYYFCPHISLPCGMPRSILVISLSKIVAAVQLTSLPNHDVIHFGKKLTKPKASNKTNMIWPTSVKFDKIQQPSPPNYSVLFPTAFITSSAGLSEHKNAMQLLVIEVKMSRKHHSDFRKLSLSLSRVELWNWWYSGKDMLFYPRLING